MRILLISAYHGGSHKAWAEGYQQYSSHQVDLLTLPARFWKWRMHGGAVTLARRFLEQIASGDSLAPELLFFTDMIDISTFLALIRRSFPDLPAALYMHENQLTYPLPATADSGPMRRQQGERDQHYSFINYASMMSADKVYFNSDFHRRELFEALPRYLRHFPEYNELRSVSELQARCSVLPVGVDCGELNSGAPARHQADSPLLIWNQRWEFDKNPGQFFEALIKLAGEGFDFRLAVCGERFAREPAEFDAARELLQDRIVHWGYAEREQYVSLLWQATITVSTALHEFFGISLLEAMYCQTYAILPSRLSYPELLPGELHDYCLYADDLQLMDRLRWALMHPGQAADVARRLSRAVSKYDWRHIADLYDKQLEKCADLI